MTARSCTSPRRARGPRPEGRIPHRSGRLVGPPRSFVPARTQDRVYPGQQPGGARRGPAGAPHLHRAGESLGDRRDRPARLPQALQPRVEGRWARSVAAGQDPRRRCTASFSYAFLFAGDFRRGTDPARPRRRRSAESTSTRPISGQLDPLPAWTPAPNRDTGTRYGAPSPPGHVPRQQAPSTRRPRRRRAARSRRRLERSGQAGQTQPGRIVALVHGGLLVVGSRQIRETGIARTERVRLDPGTIRSPGVHGSSGRDRLRSSLRVAIASPTRRPVRRVVGCHRVRCLFVSRSGLHAETNTAINPGDQSDTDAATGGLA